MRHLTIEYQGKTWTIEYHQPDSRDYKYLEIWLVCGEEELDFHSLPNVMRMKVYSLAHQANTEDRCSE